MTIPAPSPYIPEPPSGPDVTPTLPLPPDVNPGYAPIPMNDPLPPLAPPGIMTSDEQHRS